MNIKLFGIVFMVIALVGCNYPGLQGTAQPEELSTQAAKTVVAQLTSVAGGNGQAEATLQPGIGTQAQPTTRPVSGTKAPVASQTPTLFIPPTATLPAQLTPTQPLAPTPTENLKKLYSTDFSKDSGWYTTNNDSFTFKLTNGGYEFDVNFVNGNVWSVHDQSYADVVLETNAERLGGPEDGYYGLMCRQVDSHNYYAFVIGSNGFYGIGKMLDGDFQFIKSETDATGTIKQGANVLNKIRADCVGDTLRLYVNGQRMIETTDSDFKEGVTGLLAGTRKTSGLQAMFDDFTVYKPLS